MDLLSDIPDFVRSEIFSSTAQTSPTTTTHHSPFWQKWHELGLVVEKCVTPETSFQELTLRDLLASLPCGSVQATDANGFWSSTAFPSHFKFTTHSHFLSTGSRTGIAYDPRPGEAGSRTYFNDKMDPLPRFLRFTPTLGAVNLIPPPLPPEGRGGGGPGRRGGGLLYGPLL